MNEFYAMGNWATMFPESIKGWNGGVREGKESIQRGKLGGLGHDDPIFKYPDIILYKNNYWISKIKHFTLDILCITALITIRLYPAAACN